MRDASACSSAYDIHVFRLARKLDRIIDATAPRMAASRSPSLHPCSCHVLNATRSSRRRIAAAARYKAHIVYPYSFQLLIALRMLRFAGDSVLMYARSCFFFSVPHLANTHDAKPAR